jgi:putative glutamine amidotransferase
MIRERWPRPCPPDDVGVEPGSLLASAIGGTRLPLSCYHHQCLGRLGAGLRVVARAGDGVTEVVELPGRRSWFLGVRWHPEDLASENGENRALFEALVRAVHDHSQPYD